MRYTVLILITILTLAFGIYLSVFRQLSATHTYPVDANATLLIGRGYGGELPLAVTTDTNNLISSIKILQHNETPSYTGKLDSFLQQFIGKGTSNKLILGHDIDGMTGATVTSSGINRAVVHHFKPSLAPAAGPIDFIPLLTALLLLGLAIAALLLKSPVLRWGTLIGGFIFFGMIHRSMLSIVGLINAAMLNLPPLDVSTLLALTLAIGFIPALILGRIYCGSLCPFSLIQELTANFLPVKWRRPKISPDVNSLAKYIKYILAIGLILGCISFRSTAPAGIEPFITLFSRNATLLAWLFFGLMTIISIFYYRFWCVYLCPVGALTGLTAKFSWFKLKPSQQCSGGCQVCTNICPVNAISTADDKSLVVDEAECILCGKCLKGCKESCFQLTPRFAIKQMVPAAPLGRAHSSTDENKASIP